MRVLMFGWEFPPYNVGGLGTACQGLTKALSSKGVDIIFVLPRKVDLNVDYLKLVYGDEGMEKKVYLVNSLLKAYHSSSSYSESFSSQEKKSINYASDLISEVERYASVAGEIARNENFDVIHAHDWLTFKAGMAAKNATGKKLVIHVHATEFDRTGGNGVNQYVYDVEKQGMENADLIIAVSNFTKNKIVDHYGISPEKIRVVHNAVEFENYTLEKAHKLKENNKIVLYLGRLTLQKGPDYFVYAAKKVLEKEPNTIFIIAGTGDMERLLIRKVAEMGISDKVLFTGFLRGDDIHKAYRMADVYVMPSVSEPFGITPLESIMNGTPVIISRQSGVSEVISHCLKVDFWDVNQISNKIISLLKYPELHQTMKENGAMEVQKIRWENPAEKCIGIYNEVLV